MSRVVAGLDHAVALTARGEAYAWGSNRCGQLGTGDFIDALTPQRILSSHTIVDVAVGVEHTLALASDGVDDAIARASDTAVCVWFDSAKRRAKLTIIWLQSIGLRRGARRALYNFVLLMLLCYVPLLLVEVLLIWSPLGRLRRFLQHAGFAESHAHASVSV